MPVKAKDKDNRIVYIDDAIPGEMYYCPICNQPMMQKRGEILMHHFSHYSPHGRTDIIPCSDHWNYCKTEWHYEWQKRFPVDNMERVVEHNGQKHIADVLVGNYVVEFQHSPITLKEFNERNDFYTSAGYKVIWIFDLVDEYAEGRFALDNERDEWYYKWAFPKKLFREMDFSAVKATLYLQLSDEDDGESCVLERVVNVYHEGGHVKTSENNALSIKDFVSFIKSNSDKVFEKPKPAPAPKTIDGCDYILNLWDESYSSMIVKNNHEGYLIRVYGKEGKLIRDYRTNRIRCRYVYKDTKSSLYKTKSDFYNVNGEEKKIWTFVCSVHDNDYEKRVAKREQEEKERIEAYEKRLKETEPYRKAEQKDCYILEQLLWPNKNLIFVTNVYTNKVYQVVAKDIRAVTEVYELNPKNICNKITGNIKDELEEQFRYKIWKVFI